MDKYQFTETDRQILSEYKKTVQVIGRMFGNTCECVLHSLEDLEKSVVCIHNGSKTGRTIGSPITDKALALLKACNNGAEDVTGIYRTAGKHGEEMRSCTMVIRNLQGHPIGMMCLNFDLSSPLSSLKDLLNFGTDASTEELHGEHFALNIDDLLETFISRIREQVMQDESIPVRNKTKTIIYRLNEEGIFKLNDAVSACVRILQISKDTVYLHLRGLKK